jgi:hypothetical protein
MCREDVQSKPMNCKPMNLFRTVHTYYVLILYIVHTRVIILLKMMDLRFEPHTSIPENIVEQMNDILVQNDNRLWVTSFGKASE